MSSTLTYSFTVYDRKQASKQAHTHTCTISGSHVSVGLAQAHPNNHLNSNVHYIVLPIPVSGCSKPKGATNLSDPLACEELAS